MKTLKLIGILLIFPFTLYSQGTNNNFNYDKEDLNVIFKELGISTFKYPIKQSPDQLVNFIIEEYENKELIKKISVIDEINGAAIRAGSMPTFFARSGNNPPRHLAKTKTTISDKHTTIATFKGCCLRNTM